MAELTTVQQSIGQTTINKPVGMLLLTAVATNGSSIPLQSPVSPLPV